MPHGYIPPVYDLTQNWPEGPAWMVHATKKFAEWQARGFVYMKDEDMGEVVDLAYARQKAHRLGFAAEFDPLYFCYLASKKI